MNDFVNNTIKDFEKIIEEFRKKNEQIMSDKTIDKAVARESIKSNLKVMLAYQMAVDKLKIKDD